MSLASGKVENASLRTELDHKSGVERQCHSLQTKIDHMTGEQTLMGNKLKKKEEDLKVRSLAPFF